MKKNNISYLRILIFVCLSVIMLFSCQQLNSPPSINSVQKHYMEHEEDIQLITQFLLSSDYEDIYITDSKGSMLADLNEISIEDSDVSGAIRRIIDGGIYYHIAKNGNTIYLLQWKGIRDIGCGIAYSINGIDDPEIQFVTQLTPLSEDGWFYYVSDYEEWRNAQ